MGFKQLPNESYIDYIKRVSKSKIWTSDDNAAYDLTLDGSAKLNNMTSMNQTLRIRLIQACLLILVH